MDKMAEGLTSEIRQLRSMVTVRNDVINELNKKSLCCHKNGKKLRLSLANWL